MTIRFDGQVAIITGSGRGLGAAYARLLAERGASVVVHDAGVALDGTGSDPGVAFLASSQCDFSGVVLQAGNGHFSAVRWQRSAGIDFGETIATPEAIADRWRAIITT